MMSIFLIPVRNNIANSSTSDKHSSPKNSKRSLGCIDTFLVHTYYYIRKNLAFVTDKRLINQKSSDESQNFLFLVIILLTEISVSNFYSTVTALAKLRGLSTSSPRCIDA